MVLSRFERVLPWSGAIAGLAWQHYSSVETQTAATGSDQPAADGEINHEGHDGRPPVIPIRHSSAGDRPDSI